MAAWDKDLDPAGSPPAPAASGKRPAWEADLDPPAVVKVGRGLMDIPRQVGLTARYGLEGLGQAAELITEPVRQYVTDPLVRLATGEQGQSKSAGGVASSLADTLGLPKPEGANERVVADVTRMMAGAGGLGGAGRAITTAANTATQAAARGGASAPVAEIVSKIGQFFSANPGAQVASAAGAGGAGGSVREAGGGAGAQATAALLGGLAAPAAVAGAQSVAGRVQQAVRPATALQQVDQQIELALRREGVDWAQVPERLRQGLRAEAQAALRTGDNLDAQALRRLLDFRRVEGTTPTRGTLTLDPVQITRERNLAKSGANSADAALQGLAQAENANNRALIGALNNAGALNAPDRVTGAQRVIQSLQRNVDADAAEIGGLYNAARDTAGRSFPLDGASFTSRANKALDDALLGGQLPPGVADHMNRIARGEVPFTVDYAEQLKTAIGNLQRSSTDGSVRRALGIVRGALDDTPVMGLGQQGPAAGARPNNPGMLPAIPNAPDLGQQSVEAFNRARAANRAMMQRVESTPALAAVRDGVEPDKFVQRFITGNGPEASIQSVQNLRREIANDPEAVAAVRSMIADHLKGQALGGAADEVGNFSATNFRKALDAIGDRKLRAFFSPEEIEQLQAVSRVSSYLAHQPKGSAVNNSNSGALVVGRGLDFLDQVASKIPLGFKDVIQGTVRGQQQRQAQDVVPVLVQQARRTQQGRLPAAGVSTGLFLAPGAPRAEDERGR